MTAGNARFYELMDAVRARVLSSQEGRAFFQRMYEESDEAHQHMMALDLVVTRLGLAAADAALLLSVLKEAQQSENEEIGDAIDSARTLPGATDDPDDCPF